MVQTDLVKQYKEMIYDFFFNPIEQLMNSEKNIYCIFNWEIAYFEHLGQVLNGQINIEPSNKIFISGLKAVLPEIFKHFDELNSSVNVQKETYSKAKLFHQALNNEFYKIIKMGLFPRKTDLCSYRLNSRFQAFISLESKSPNSILIEVNPIMLFEKIRIFHDLFIKKLEASESPEIDQFESFMKLDKT